MSDDLTIPVQTENRSETDGLDFTELEARGGGFTLRTDDGTEVGVTMSRSDLARALLHAATTQRLADLFDEDSGLIAAFKDRLKRMANA